MSSNEWKPIGEVKGLTFSDDVVYFNDYSSAVILKKHELQILREVRENYREIGCSEYHEAMMDGSQESYESYINLSDELDEKEQIIERRIITVTREINELENKLSQVIKKWVYREYNSNKP